MRDMKKAYKKLNRKLNSLGIEVTTYNDHPWHDYVNLKASNGATIKVYFDNGFIRGSASKDQKEANRLNDWVEKNADLSAYQYDIVSADANEETGYTSWDENVYLSGETLAQRAKQQGLSFKDYVAQDVENKPKKGTQYKSPYARELY